MTDKVEDYVAGRVAPFGEPSVHATQLIEKTTSNSAISLTETIVPRLHDVGCVAQVNSRGGTAGHLIEKLDWTFL